MASIREFTLDVATHAAGHPQVVLMGKEKMGQLSEMPGGCPPKCHPWAGCLLSSIFFCLSMFPKESFSITSVYHCFPGALVKMLALKGEKQVSSLCKRPFSGEIMFFPKLRVHCCWATAKCSLPTPSGGDNNAHVCHFLISVEIAGLIFMAEKTLIWKINTHPPQRLHLPDYFISMSSASAHLALHCQGCVLSNDSAPCCPAVPRGRGWEPAWWQVRDVSQPPGLVPISCAQHVTRDLQGIVSSATTKF